MESFSQSYACFEKISKKWKRSISDICEIGVRVSKGKEIHKHIKKLKTLVEKTKKAESDRVDIYDELIERITFPTSLKDKYYDYMEYINPIDRLSYIDRLRGMTTKKLDAHMHEMYVNPLIDEIGEKFTDEEKKKRHRDLYGFKNDPQSMIIITMAFLKKIRQVPQNKRKPIYRKYANLDVEDLKTQGFSTDTIKSRILTGLIESLVYKSDKEQHVFIENMFDVDYSF